MEGLLELVGKLESLGVAALLFLAIVFIVKYFKAVIVEKTATIMDLAKQVRELSEKRLEDQKEWAERYKDGTVRMETALAEVTKAIGENQRAVERVELKVG